VGSIASVSVFEVPPPGPGLTTCTRAIPPALKSPELKIITADVSPALVVWGAPFTSTTASDAMPVPEMERLVAAPPAAMVAGLKEVMLGTGLLILNENVLELPPPGDGLADSPR